MVKIGHIERLVGGANLILLGGKMNKYRFIVEKFNENNKWVVINYFDNLYQAHCYILMKRRENNYKYRILEVLDLYV